MEKVYLYNQLVSNIAKNKAKYLIFLLLFAGFLLFVIGLYIKHVLLKEVLGSILSSFGAIIAGVVCPVQC